MSPLGLEENLAIVAGAGAGKTYSLVTICLNLLSGARKGGSALRPSELCLLTFTDKAAAEMRSRLRARIDALATGEAGPADEVDLSASCAALGRTFPGPEVWKGVRDDLGSAWIGTFHSLCAQILRRAPAGFGVDPGFTLLDERDARSLLRDTAERVVLEALDREEPEVVDLCREMGFSARGHALGAVGALCDVLGKLREEGLSPRAVPITDLAQARREFDRALQTVRDAAAAATALDGPKGRFCSVLSACARALDGLRYESFLHADRFLALRAALQSERALTNQRQALGDALKALKWNALGNERVGPGLLQHYAACEIVRHEAAFRRLVGELLDRYRAELRRRSALDFSELLIQSRDLLRDHPTPRRELQERMRALLVDELQDTNRLQLEILTLLGEQREGGPRVVPADGALGLPLEPAFLCAVGDRKQSIYEFRGANVSVFAALSKALEQSGGRRHFLKTNRRSTPALIAFYNRLFPAVLSPTATIHPEPLDKLGVNVQSRSSRAESRDPRPSTDAQGEPADYEVAYVPAEDDLEPHRTGRATRPSVERLIYDPHDRAPESRGQDAELLARRIRQLLSPRSGLKISGADGKLRPAVGRDVAILFRRFSFLEVYRQALAKVGVAHRVVRGRGFYAAQEVVDLASLLSVVADPSDDLGFAAVLRSPLVALSDAALFRLATASGGRLGLWAVRRMDRSALGLPADELQRLEQFLDLHARLRSERDRLGLRTVLGVALEETSYRVAVAGAPFGEQALANLDKLLELAGRWDDAGRGDCHAFATELLELAEAEPAEAQADVMDAGDERAVSLLTIHQAKGLEWPVVAIPDLAAGPLPQAKRALFDRTLGLGLKPWIDGELDVGRSPRLQQIAKELSRREEAEYRRLFYVALTRARDHLVLSGQSKAARSATWRALLDRAIDGDPALRAMVLDVREADLPEVKAAAGLQGSLLLDGTERVAAAVERCERPAPLRPRTAVLPVTMLQSWALCERRYLYSHVVGLAELPGHLEPDEGELPEGAGPADPRARGTAAHQLLQRVDLAAIGDRKQLDAQLRQLLWELGHEPDSQDARQIAGWARAFLSTPFAAALRGARVLREVPFLVPLRPDGELQVHLKGQIDLLVVGQDGQATVIDYKASLRPSEGLAPYAFQLDCYALAASRLLGGVGVRTGVAFLKEADPGPDFRESATPLDVVEARLAVAAVGLARSAAATQWQGRDPSYCASIRCGYQYRCHARAGAC